MEIYRCVARDIAIDDVVITEKQIKHIFEDHPEKEHANVIARLKAAILEPDYILKDAAPRTAVVFKQFVVQDERYRIILKLAAADDPIHPLNSIITAFYISEKKWNKSLRNKTILYKRGDL
ncbi:MAG: hypothetical protein IJ466_02665 [Clostridia bacterium]|nr:hypothetical protein [Clostridia bacterium]